MPCNFRLREIGWIFFLFFVASCSEKTSLQIFQPAEIDTSDIQRIAIGVFEIGAVQENFAVERAGDWTKKSVKLTDEERQILSRNVRALLANQLTKVPFWEIGY